MPSVNVQDDDTLPAIHGRSRRDAQPIPRYSQVGIGENRARVVAVELLTQVYGVCFDKHVVSIITYQNPATMRRAMR